MSDSFWILTEILQIPDNHYVKWLTTVLHDLADTALQLKRTYWFLMLLVSLSLSYELCWNQLQLIFRFQHMDCLPLNSLDIMGWLQYSMSFYDEIIMWWMCSLSWYFVATVKYSKYMLCCSITATIIGICNLSCQLATFFES